MYQGFVTGLFMEKVYAVLAIFFIMQRSRIFRGTLIAHRWLSSEVLWVTSLGLFLSDGGATPPRAHSLRTGAHIETHIN